MQFGMREACLQATFALQLRSKYTVSGASWHRYGERSQSKRERRVKRQLQNSLLKQIFTEAEWSFQRASSWSQPIAEAGLSDEQLWRYMAKGKENSRRARRGWLKWLKQGGAAQKGREEAWHSNWHRRDREERWQQSSAGRWTPEEWESHARSWRHRYYFKDGFWHYFAASQQAGSARDQKKQTAGGGKRHSQPPSYHADSVHASSLRTLGLQTSRSLTSASLRDAFRACALAWHPDRHAGPEKHAAEAKFKEAQSAYTLLKSLCVA